MYTTAFLDLPALQSAGGTLQLPGSKSISNRVLLLAALCSGRTTVLDLLDSDDTRVMLEALRALGCSVVHDGNSVVIDGMGGELRVHQGQLFMGNAGTAIRPLTAALAVMGGDFELRGVPRMHERPIGDLVDALRQLGCQIDCLEQEGYPPLRIGRPTLRLDQPIRVRGDVSSQFLTALLMALPLVPDRPLWGTPLNPHKVVQLLVLLLAVQSLAHLAGRLLAARHAVAVSALASGFVSSTATIATLGLAVREQGASPRLMAGGGLLSCVSTQIQLLLVAAAMQPAWLARLWLPALLGALVVAVWGWALVRGAHTGDDGLAVSSPRIEGLGAGGDDRMFSLRGAAAVAALLSGIQLAVHALQRWLGDAGLVAGALVAALADLHSALAAVLAATAPVPGAVGVWAVALALLVHAASKSLTAGFAGGRSYLRWLAPGLWLHTLLVSAGVVWFSF